MKNDAVHNVLKWLDHNRYTVTSVLLFILTMGLAILAA